MTSSPFYRLKELAELGAKSRFVVHRPDANSIQIQLADDLALRFTNVIGEEDTIAGFVDSQTHFHGKLVVATGGNAFEEYDELELLVALVDGELLVVSRFVHGQIRDRGLAHKTGKIDVRYLEPGEELRVRCLTPPAL